MFGLGLEAEFRGLWSRFLRFWGRVCVESGGFLGFRCCSVRGGGRGWTIYEVRFGMTASGFIRIEGAQDTPPLGRGW